MDSLEKRASDRARRFYRYALNLFAAMVLFLMASNAGEQLGRAAWRLTH